MVVVFLALGTWQVKRLYWKRDLIERVESRVHAKPTPAPGRNEWPGVNAANSAYLHVVAVGNFLYSCSVRVKAVTVLGSGSWIVTPLRQENGDVLLVNRGFVPIDPAGAAAPRKCTPESDLSDTTLQTITGLLRISEPGGAFLRHNDPVMQRWYSRDVKGIAAAQALDRVAPYFVDADANTAPITAPSRAADATAPVGGLTVIKFADDHLVYAITWFVLALMAAAAAWRVLRVKA